MLQYHACDEHVLYYSSPPVLVAPKLLLEIPVVRHLVSEGGLTLDPVHHLPVHSNGHLKSEVRRLVIATGPQGMLV